jgi:hypothetical protein
VQTASSHLQTLPELLLDSLPSPTQAVSGSGLRRVWGRGGACEVRGRSRAPLFAACRLMAVNSVTLR